MVTDIVMNTEDESYTPRTIKGAGQEPVTSLQEDISVKQT